ncbi:MAG: ATP-binding protein [Gammaproteobacteria bacterium]|nr:ATP-binding protein [Gammaproteobacteria bacterium]
MPHMPPDNPLDVLQSLDFNEGLGAGDPRYVETQEARGSQKTLSRLARKFGLDLTSGRLAALSKSHVLLFGHTGSGKTTELRHYAAKLGEPGRFFIIEVDIVQVLDSNNLQYADALMAMAEAVLKELQLANVGLESGALNGLHRWFSQRVLETEAGRELSAELETGGEAKLEIPFLMSLFAKFTTAFKTNVAYKDSLRREIRNHFSELKNEFNEFLDRAEQALVTAGKNQRILFVLDGTDKLRGEDTHRFFVEDAEQLLAIEARAVYTAPLALKYEGNLTNKLDADLVLPMIKLSQGGQRFAPGWQAMRDILLRRAARSLFASEAEIEKLIEFSGGHPRELLRLLKLCCEFAEQPLFDRAVIDAAVKQLASEYRRFLDRDDYTLLKQVDADGAMVSTDDRTRKLLYHLALLEYNDGSWRASHPVVRLLEGYIRDASP